MHRRQRYWVRSIATAGAADRYRASFYPGRTSSTGRCSTRLRLVRPLAQGMTRPSTSPCFSRPTTPRASAIRGPRRGAGCALESHAIGLRGPAVSVDHRRRRAGTERARAWSLSRADCTESRATWRGGAACAAGTGRPDGFAAARRGLVLVHALDPYGFAWVRRSNEENVDLNRNFLLSGEHYSGSPPRYVALDSLPQPPGSAAPPRRVLAPVGALHPAHGMPELKQAVAGGQYDFPRGLFFGGQGPSRTYRILAEHFGRWVATPPACSRSTSTPGWVTGRRTSCLVDEGLDPRRFDSLQADFWRQAPALRSCPEHCLPGPRRPRLVVPRGAARPLLRSALRRVRHLSTDSCPGGVAGREPGPFLGRFGSAHRALAKKRLMERSSPPAHPGAPGPLVRGSRSSAALSQRVANLRVSLGERGERIALLAFCMVFQLPR